MKLHTGDTVLIISGKDKGKTGSIMRVMPEKNHVVVSGINMRTRHIKKTHQEAGRILKYEASLDASKVMVLDPKTKKPTRIGFKMVDGKKIRIAKLSGEEVKAVKAPKQAKKQAVDSKEEKKETSKTSEQAKGDGGKQPFWKKLQFGATAAEQGGDGGEAKAADHATPSKAIPRKSSGRGS